MQRFIGVPRNDGTLTAKPNGKKAKCRLDRQLLWNVSH